MPTTAVLNGSIVLISNIAPNHTITLESNGAVQRQMEVFDNGTLVKPNKPLYISSITAVSIQVVGGDKVIINDSNGMPFAQEAAVTLYGSGANSMTLEGSRAISGNETYVAGGASYTPGTISVDNISFQLTSAIASVTDLFQITGLLDVQTSGTNVVLSGSNGTTQTLSGMGFGGGDTLTYANKDIVQLDAYAVNANVSLNATARASLEQYFTVELHGAGDTTVIAATPSQVLTYVFSIAAPVANQASVYLEANAGPVAVFGNSSTQLVMGRLTNGEFSTHGIQNTVSVSGVGLLFLSDSANVSTPENVTVTESTIAGTGLFGNNGVKLFYSNVGTVSMVTGQDGAEYVVEGSHSGAKFTSHIDITFFSTVLDNVPYRANVFVDSGSQLQLELFNNTKQQAELDIHTDGDAGLPGTLDGTVDVTFPGVPNSETQIEYNNFDLVFAQG